MRIKDHRGAWVDIMEDGEAVRADGTVVPDGARLRVPAMLMDGVPPTRVHDGTGRPAGDRPGFLFGGVSAAVRDAAERARAEYLAAVREAWRQPA